VVTRSTRSTSFVDLSPDGRYLALPRRQAGHSLAFWYRSGAMRVCFASMERFHGCVTACRHAASVLGGSWATISRHDATPPEVLDADLVILSSWHERYESILDERTGPVVPRFHSMVLETELSQEGAKLARMVALLDAGSIPALAVSDPHYIGILGRPGVVNLPDVLDPGIYRGVIPSHLMGVNVSLFGEAHWRKNILAQAAGFDRARRDVGGIRWTLHLNGQTTADEDYALWLETTRIPFVDHGRLDRDPYLALVAAMDVGLCAALRESYCHVAADHVALGVPVVASAGVPCLGAWPHRVPVHDVDAIALALTTTLADRESIAAGQKQSLHDQARVNEAQARRGLAKILAASQDFARAG
jgi:hypothetical protein